MDLGTFSVSLNVADINASKEFYEKIGFEIVSGDIEEKWLIMQNETATIGLFQDMFDRNILTFNPGWDENAQELEEYTDVNEIRRTFEERGIEVVKEISGDRNFVIIDPDGNPILVDQHTGAEAEEDDADES